VRSGVWEFHIPPKMNFWTRLTAETEFKSRLPIIKIRTWRPKCSQTVFRYAEMGASCYASVPGGQLLLDFIEAFNKSEFSFDSLLAWVKNQFVLERCDYQFRHENVLYSKILQSNCRSDHQASEHAAESMEYPRRIEQCVKA